MAFSWFFRCIMVNYLLDNSIFSPLISADSETIKFALRNRLYIEETALTEAKKGHSFSEVRRTIANFRITEVESAKISDVVGITAALGITIVKPDLTILSTAHKHGLGLVTGDNKLFRRAVRLRFSGLSSQIGTVKYRLFVPAMSARERISGYQKARRYIQRHFPDLDPHHFTGGR
jgi:predicted nucleic acid-binding protein